MHMLCNINPKPWLTFPFEFSSMTCPIGFDFPAGVSPYMQPISIQVLTLRFISQTWHHVSLAKEDILTQTPCLIQKAYECVSGYTSKLEHTRTDKGSMKHDWAFIQKAISMSTNLVILGRPPGRALFNVKSRTLRVLTTAFCWWRLNVVAMATPLIHLFFIESKMRGHTQISRQDMNWEGNLLWGTHIPPRHLEFAKLQVYGVQVFLL